MLVFLIGSALAGGTFEETELETGCLLDGTCQRVTGEVIDATCRSTSRDSYGIIYRKFSAEIEVVEGRGTLRAGTTFILHTETIDYSEADESIGMPGCSTYDPGHPVGEIARYYLNPALTNGAYTLYGTETFYHEEDSLPSPEPICAEFESDWSPSGSGESASGSEAEDAGSAAEPSEIKVSRANSCSTAPGVKPTGEWVMLAGLLWGIRRKR